MRASADDAHHLDRTAVAFAGVVTAVHLAIYARAAGGPLGQAPVPWLGWWDQSQYLNSAIAFAHGNLSPEHHWYALGYPLLGAPFVSVLSRDPFFLVNTVSLVVFALAFLAYFRPIIGAIPATAAFMAAQLLPATADAPHRIDFPVWLQYVIPWNTAPVAALLMLLLVLVRGLRADESARRDAVLGALAAVVVTIRPSDAVALLVAGAFYAHHRLVRHRALAHVGVALAAAAGVLGAYAALSYAIYGGLATPYHDEVRKIGASLSDLHERFYAIVIDATVTHEEPRAALAAMQPWLILALPLSLAWLIVDVPRGLLVVGTALLSLLTYVAFNDFWPYALLRLSLMHYVTWTLPIFTAAGVAGALVLAGHRRWKLLTAALLFAAVLAAVRVVAVPVAARVVVADEGDGSTRYDITLDARQEIDAVDFVGADVADTRAVTVLPFTVASEGHPLALYGGYRAIQLRHGLRLLLNAHVETTRLQVTLGRTIARHPTGPAGVQPVRFRFTLALR